MVQVFLGAVLLYPVAYLGLRATSVLVLRECFVGGIPHPTRGMVEADYSQSRAWVEIGRGPFDEDAYLQRVESGLDVGLRQTFSALMVIETWLRGYPGRQGPRGRQWPP